MVRAPPGRRLLKWVMAVVVLGLAGRIGLTLSPWVHHVDHSMVEKYQGSGLAAQEIRVVE